MKRYKLQNSNGYSLVELMASVAFLSIALLVIIGIQTRLKHTVAISEQYSNAVTLAENQMELLLSSDLTQFEEKQNYPFFTDAGSLRNLPSSTGIFFVEKKNIGYEICVDIDWMAKKYPLNYKLRTIKSYGATQ